MKLYKDEVMLLGLAMVVLVSVMCLGDTDSSFGQALYTALDFVASETPHV